MKMCGNCEVEIREGTEERLVYIVSKQPADIRPLLPDPECCFGMLFSLDFFEGVLFPVLLSPFVRYK